MNSDPMRLKISSKPSLPRYRPVVEELPNGRWEASVHYGTDKVIWRSTDDGITYDTDIDAYNAARERMMMGGG